MDYSEVVEVYKKLESTSKRLEKTYYVSEVLAKAKVDELYNLTLMLQGKIFPNWDERKIGVASRLVLKSLNIVSGKKIEDIENHWKKTGDIGETAKQLISKKSQSTLFRQKLTAEKVLANLRKLAELEGEGTVDMKVKLIAELLSNAEPEEAKFVVRNILEDMRIGVGEGVVRDAIVWAFFPKVLGLFYECECGAIMPQSEKCLKCGRKHKASYKDDINTIKSKEKTLIAKSTKDVENNIKYLEKYEYILAEDEKIAREIYNYFCLIVQEAYDITNDFGEVAYSIKKHSIKSILEINLVPGRPVKVMLAQKVKDIKEGFETVNTPCAIEYKLDGFRMQIHKKDKKIIIYTRRLENVTNQFPEVVEYVKEHIDAASFILDCEAVGYDKNTKKYLPFQNISQRIKRKYNISEMAEKYPVELNIFDIIYLNGRNLIKTDFIDRRKALESIIKNPIKNKIVLVPQIITKDEKSAEKFYKESLGAGNEGVMLKNLHSPYKPGSRVGYMVKLKPIMDTLDVVVVGAEWGEGKRGKWLSSFTIAVRDEMTDDFVEVGKVGTGFKELEEAEGVSFEQMTKLLEPLIISEKGKSVRVKPEVVIEVSYEEIQKSPTYSSGYALRFPRLVRIRDDRAPEECSTMEEVSKLFEGQRGR